MTVIRRPDPIPLSRTRRLEEPRSLQAVRAEPDDLHRLVARRIFNAIATGTFPVGSILPNEHQLSEQLGVSRTALREAIKGLASKGMVETRRRRGTLVLERSRWNMLDAEMMSWARRSGSPELISRQLFEAFVSAQPALAALAATRGAGSRLKRAATAVATSAPGEARVAAFAEFHHAVAAAAGNPYLASLATACLDNLVAEDPDFLTRAVEQVTVGDYLPLAAAILAGETEAARAQMLALFDGERVAAL